MRRTFFAHYRPHQEEFSELWEKCLFVPDANVLLNLYRYSHETNMAWIGVLEKIADRLWIPHQAALEYQDNRLGVISEQEGVYEELSKIFHQAQDDIENLLRRGHLSIDVSDIEQNVGRTFDELRHRLGEHREQHPDLLQQDTIRDSITSLFDGRVGTPYTQTRLSEIYRTGEQRYEKRVPPGYKDRDKKGVKSYGNLAIEDKYGDLILWLQILDKAKEVQKPIIFVSDDDKEDWWWKSKGRTIGPRPELLTEMRLEASVLFYMYSPNQFLEYAGKLFEVSVNQNVINEMNELEEALSWKEEIVRALEGLGGEAHLSGIYDYIHETSRRALPESWQPIIRKVLQLYSADSPIFRGSEDLFARKGSGVWALKSAVTAPTPDVASDEGVFAITSRDQADRLIRYRLASGVSPFKIADELSQRGVDSGWILKRIRELTNAS